MAEQLEDIPPQTEIPQDEPYVKKVYSDMQSRYGANNIIPFDQFSKKISTDKNYATQVHDDMAKQYGANNIISVDEFFNNVKKKDTTPLPSSGGGTTLPSQNTKSDFLQQGQDLATGAVLKDVHSLQAPTTSVHSPQSVKVSADNSKPDMMVALTNTSKNLLKSQGQEINTANLNRTKEQVSQGIKQGKYSLTTDNSGEPIYGRSPSMSQAFTKGLLNHVMGWEDAIDQYKNLNDPKQLAATLDSQIKRRQDAKSLDVGIGDLLSMYGNATKMAEHFAKSDTTPMGEPTGMSAAAEMAGSIAPYAIINPLGVGAVGAESFVSSAAPKMQELYQNKLDELKQQGVPEDKAKEQAAVSARNSTPLAALPQAALNTYLMKGGGTLTPAAKNFGEALVNITKSSAKLGVMGAASEAATQGIQAAQGFKTDDVLNKIKDAGGSWFLQTAMLEGLMHLPSLPKYGQAALKEFAIQPENQHVVDATLQSLPPEKSAEITTDLNNYKTARKSVEGLVPEEHIPTFAGLMEKRNNLEQSKEGKSKALTEPIDDEIKSIDDRLATMQKTGKVNEVDDLTGQPINPTKTYDELTKQEREGIVVPKEHGYAEVEEKGEGENKTYVPKAYETVKEGGLEKSKPIKIEEEKTYTDKDKAQKEADETLGKHYYENAMPEHDKPVAKDISSPKIKNDGNQETDAQTQEVGTTTIKEGAGNTVPSTVKSEGLNDKNGLVLYHGSPHSFENFDISKLGSGEGAQAFGHGLYFTNEESIAKGYANKLGSKKNFWEALMDGNKISLSKEDFDFINKDLDSLGYDGSRAENENIGEINVGDKVEHSPETLEALAVLFGKNAKGELEGSGLSEEEINRLLEIKKKISDPQLYKIAAHEGKSPSEYDYINWHDKLTDTQRQKISDKIELPKNVTGKDAYKKLSYKLGSDKKASEYLLSKGIDGITYKSHKGTGGDNGEGRNYVIFDPKSIRVDEINGKKQKNETTQDTKQAETKIAEPTKPIENIQPTSEGTDSKENTAGVGGKEPPTETVDNDGDGTEYTSLKKRIYDTERDAEGKPVMDTTTGKSAVERANETKAKIESGEISQQEITDIATALANKTDINTKLKPEEIEHVLAYDKVRLNKEGRQISKDLVDAQKEGNKEKEADLLFKDAQNQILREENYRATKNLNAEWGRQGQAIQLSIDNDYSFEHLKDRIGKALNDEDIPKATRDKLKELSDKIGDLQDKVDEHAKKLKEHEDALKKSEDAKLLLEEENSRLKAQAELDNKKEESENKRQQKKGDLAKQKKDTIEQIKARYNKLRGSANSGLNFNLLELAPDIAKLARIHVEEGVIKIEELVDKMYDDLKDFIPNLSKRELRDVFSGYGKLQKLSDDKIDIELGKLKAHGKALSGLEDVVEKNQAPLRSGTSHREPTSEVKALRKQINDEMRKRGIDIRKVKDPEKVWKTALESFKTKTENRIKYLENVKGINDIERFKKEQEKVKLKLDKEASDLKTKVQAEKNRVDGLVKQYEFNNWSKFDKALHYANQFSKGVLISNPAILVKILGSVIWRGATKWATASIKYGVSKAIPSVSKLEGINTSRDLADHISKYYSTMFSKENWQGVKDAFKNKGAGEDLLYGKKYSKNEIPQYSFKTNWGNPAKALADVSKASFFWTLRALEKNAQLHGSEKSAASKPAFEAYKQTIQRNFDRNRTDISTSLIKEGLLPKEFSNEHVQEMVNQLAFQKSLREKFMQDDKISNAQKVLEAHFRNSGNIGVAEGVNALLPVTKIGSNFIGEALEQHPIIGAIPQLKNIFNLALKGENSLTQKQKYNVLRALTNQGVGLACYVAGAYLYQSINPFYQSSSRKYADKNGKELPADENNIGVIPSLLSHVPYATTFRAGASHAWVWHQYDQAHPDEGVMSKFFSTSVDALSENLRGELAASPYISMGESTLAPLLGHGDAGKAFANLVKSRLPFSSTAGELAQGKVPLLNKIAPDLSKKVGESVGLHQETDKPSPKGFLQNMEMGIPALRQNVPTKQQAKNIEAAKKGIKDPERLKERIREIMDHKNLQD